MTRPSHQHTWSPVEDAERSRWYRCPCGAFGIRQIYTAPDAPIGTIRALRRQTVSQRRDDVVAETAQDRDWARDERDRALTESDASARAEDLWWDARDDVEDV